ncbi:MAG TPA: xanthine dehydrogenase family protein subunit M [bacterium]|nr:xanthine dehydrogenase family protein subunit M [bacterium]
MKPPPFAYLAPRSVPEALEALASYGPDGKVLAGGQSLVPLLNFRLAHPAALVDLNAVPGLDGLGRDPGTGELAIGAMVRQTDAERSPLVVAECPLLVAALKHIGHRAIRNRGTVGGSLAHADPAAELPLLLVLLDGRVRTASGRGERWIGAGEFFVSYLTTALEADEILVEARFSTLRDAHTAWGFEEFSRRAGDFALAAAGAIVHGDDTGTIRDAAIAVAGGGPTPVRAREAERALAGQRPSDRLLEDAARLAISACDVDGDLHASAEYRRALIGVVVERALHQAFEGLGRTPPRT